jgi:hypothetical protein
MIRQASGVLAFARGVASITDDRTPELIKND